MGKEIEMFLLVFFLLLLILWNLFQIETYGVKFGISKYELNKCFNISRNDWNPCDWDPGIHELLLEPHASGYVKVCTMRGRGEIPLVQVSCHMRTAGTLCLLCPCRDPLIIKSPWFRREGKQKQLAGGWKLFSVVYFYVLKISIELNGFWLRFAPI